MSSSPHSANFATKAIHSGYDAEKWPSSPLVPPVSLATIFCQTAPGEKEEYFYGRAGNPNRKSLEDNLAALDGNKYGLCFASGTAAISGVCRLLRSGDHCVCMYDAYCGTHRVLDNLKTLGIEVDYVQDSVDINLKGVIKDNTKMVWLETPTNPMLKLIDLAVVTKVIRNNAPNAIIVCENTLMSPYFQRPSDYGVDVVVHALTKYINGHSDVMMGAVTTSDLDLYKRLHVILRDFGGVPSPFDCYLVTRSIKTLEVRMTRHHENGLAVAHFLEKHPQVNSVIHPGLPSHPDYELGKRQMSGYSGIITFYLKGDLARTRCFLTNLKIFSITHSFGSVDSLAELPVQMTHFSMDQETRKNMGITENMVRLSIGLENIDDLIDDLDQAFKQLTVLPNA